MDKRLIKEVIKEMIDAGEIEVSLETETYICDYEEGITLSDVKNTVREVDVIIKVNLSEQGNES